MLFKSGLCPDRCSGDAQFVYEFKFMAPQHHSRPPPNGYSYEGHELTDSPTLVDRRISPPRPFDVKNNPPPPPPGSRMSLIEDAVARKKDTQPTKERTKQTPAHYAGPQQSPIAKHEAPEERKAFSWETESWDESHDDDSPPEGLGEPFMPPREVRFSGPHSGYHHGRASGYRRSARPEVLTVPENRQRKVTVRETGRVPGDPNFAVFIDQTDSSRSESQPDELSQPVLRNANDRQRRKNGPSNPSVHVRRKPVPDDPTRQTSKPPADSGGESGSPKWRRSRQASASEILGTPAQAPPRQRNAHSRDPPHHGPEENHNPQIDLVVNSKPKPISPDEIAPEQRPRIHHYYSALRIWTCYILPLLFTLLFITTSAVILTLALKYDRKLNPEMVEGIWGAFAILIVSGVICNGCLWWRIKKHPEIAARVRLSVNSSAGDDGRGCLGRAEEGLIKWPQERVEDREKKRSGKTLIKKKSGKRPSPVPGIMMTGALGPTSAREHVVEPVMIAAPGSTAARPEANHSEAEQQNPQNHSGHQLSDPSQGPVAPIITPSQGEISRPPRGPRSSNRDRLSSHHPPPGDAKNITSIPRDRAPIMTTVYNNIVILPYFPADILDRPTSPKKRLPRYRSIEKSSDPIESPKDGREMGTVPTPPDNTHCPPQPSRHDRSQSEISDSTTEAGDEAEIKAEATESPPPDVCAIGGTRAHDRPQYGISLPPTEAESPESQVPEAQPPHQVFAHDGSLLIPVPSSWYETTDSDKRSTLFNGLLEETRHPLPRSSTLDIKMPFPQPVLYMPLYEQYRHENLDDLFAKRTSQEKRESEDRKKRGKEEFGGDEVHGYPYRRRDGEWEWKRFVARNWEDGDGAEERSHKRQGKMGSVKAEVEDEADDE